jgi:hypothetical protein
MQSDDFAWLPTIKIKLSSQIDKIGYMPKIIKSMIGNDKIDISQLENYVSIIINMEDITSGIKTYHKHRFQFCTKEYYIERKITIE